MHKIQTDQKSHLQLSTEEEEVLKVSSLIFISSSLRRTGNQGIEGFQQWLTFNVAEIYRKLEVILTTSVENLGKAGEPVKVAPGYFRNDLMPEMFPVPDIEKYAYLIREQHKETVPLVSAGVNDRGEICCIKKLHPGSMGVDAKPVTKILDVCASQPDSDNEDKDLKAKLSPSSTK
ncbi:hypothetical protein MKW98_020786 [Papaver atlanticum]|uniref:Large ribosomal subunit protein bL9c n=1 Tax=Papaver atlanticum TaxID=357466 RepID=A0AAD4TFM9_9MAGN|nr:hypothetical protein MKW98_020786 [Papaver atlanticum]